MSCGFCHVGPSPTKPPADPENPKWENLNSNPGAQYFWVDRILFWEKDESNFIYQLIHTSLPGTLDTSFISSDYINNPRTMNAVYSIAARLKAAERWGQSRTSETSMSTIRACACGLRRTAAWSAPWPPGPTAMSSTYLPWPRRYRPRPA